jgi:hypothetical protein
MHARAGIDLLLSVVRQVVHEAANQRVCHQSAGSNATVNDIRLGRLLVQRLAALANPLAIDVTMHEELGRNNVQLLTDVLANAQHLAGRNPV